MVAGSARPLVDAFRIAQVELIEWLVDEYGFEKLEAYQVVSQGGRTRVANVVDPNYTVVAKFPKRLLPPKRDARGLQSRWRTAACAKAYGGPPVAPSEGGWSRFRVRRAVIRDRTRSHRRQ